MRILEKVILAGTTLEADSWAWLVHAMSCEVKRATGIHLEHPIIAEPGIACRTDGSPRGKRTGAALNNKVNTGF
jgi:hypothetical protein